MAKRKARKRNYRRAEKRTRLSSVEKREVLKLIAIALVMIGAIYLFRIAQDVPIRQVSVATELEHVNRDRVREVCSRYVGGGFFSADLKGLEQDLGTIPWIRSASVRRSWPNRIVISIEEQVPRFRWGEKGLLNKYAEPFEVGNAEMFSNLPQLHGNEGREMRLAKIYLHYSKAFREAGLVIEKLHEDERLNMQLQLKNGMEIAIGSENVSQKLDQFLRSYELFSPTQQARILAVDLRHGNGMAIRWNS